MHSRRAILENQSKFNYEIKQWFKKEMTRTKNEILDIETYDPIIMAEKKKLEEKSQKVKPEKDIKKLIINENNIYPKFYAWWNEKDEEVEILLYEAR